MYIPKPIYQYAPYYWLVVGVLLALLGFRVGSEGGQMFQYFSVTLGALSCAWGVRIIFLRRAEQRLTTVDTAVSEVPPE
jgi:hypothetical protein